MSFNKIQPEQIQLATFFSDSGDISVTQTDTGVKLNLSRGLTGDFAFTGSLKIGGRTVFGLADSGNNSFDPNDGNFLFLGNNTTLASGPIDGDNIAIRANDSNISGIGNALFNAGSVEVSRSGQNNTLVAGDTVTFTKTATGNTVIKDFNDSSALSVSLQDSLITSFSNGHFFNGGESYFGDNTSFNSSGIFSGNLDVIGSSIFTDTVTFKTGFALPIWTGLAPESNTAQNFAIGALAISGKNLVVQTGTHLWGYIGIGTSPA
tara:strand:+ start:46308 stop:47096 length:789 start_codon:yes stop_codon:yes gene_type:complete